MSKIIELYNYRELIKTSIHKEVRGKYKGSFLGIIWSFLNPLLMVLVYSVVFPLILKVNEKNYVVFLIVGLIPWTFFTTVVSQGTISILSNGNLVKKVYFPREIIPISVAASGLVNFLISCIVILLFLIFSGIGFSWNILYLPLVVLEQFVLQLSIIFVLSALNMYFRDLEYIVNVILMILFYLTPIIYNINIIPTDFVWLFKLNPLSDLIIAYRSILYYQVSPDLASIFRVGLIDVIALLVSYSIFRKLEKKFAELI